MAQLFALALLIAALVAHGPALPADTASAIQALPDGTIAVPPATQQALAYYDAMMAWRVTSTVCGTALLLLLCVSGIGVRIRDLTTRVSQRWYLQLAGSWIVLSLLIFCALLPFEYWRFSVQIAAGLSKQSITDWIGAQVLQALISAVLGAIVFCVPYALIRSNFKRPWLIAWLAAIPFVLLMKLIWPVFIDPLFAEVRPLGGQAQLILKARLEQLAERAGIARGRIFVTETSRRSNALNARVTGIGSSQRIEFNDNLLLKLNSDQVAFVIAHEIGHYALNHTWQDVAIQLIRLLVLFGGGYAAAQWLIARYPARLGFTSLGDPASLPLFMLLFAIGGGIVQPLENTLYRHEEHEADVYALELTRDNRAAAEVFVILQYSNLALPRPNPVLHFLRGTHPTLAENIEFANTYAPWREGKPLKYSAYMKPAPGEKHAE